MAVASALITAQDHTLEIVTHRVVLAILTLNTIACTILPAYYTKTPHKHNTSTLRHTLCRILKHGNSRWTLALVTSYKAGEIIGDKMFKFFLLEHKLLRIEQISRICSWTGISFSILGSWFGGYMCRDKLPHLALPKAALLSALAQILRFIVVQHAYFQNLPCICCVIAFESFSGGALSAVIFSLMMEDAKDDIGTTYYSILSTFEILGKSIPSVISGYLTDLFGFNYVFACIIAMSFLFAWITKLASNAKESFRTLEKSKND
jgi:predicted MFS family arabinose efflux permease